jgi:hypothetical protein
LIVKGMGAPGLVRVSVGLLLDEVVEWLSGQVVKCLRSLGAGTPG